MATDNVFLAQRPPILRPSLGGGGLIQRCANGDVEAIPLRDVANGVITVGSFAVLAGGDQTNESIPNGWVNIANCNSITLHCSVATGSLTGVQLKAELLSTSNLGAIVGANMTALEWDATNNKYNVYDALWERTLAPTLDIFAIHIPIFNASYIRFLIAGLGTATNSSASILAIRGWSSAPLLRA